MTNEIDSVVEQILIDVMVLQKQHHADTGECYSVPESATNLSGLTYGVLKYKNCVQGSGCGVVFDYIDGGGTRYRKSTDLGFMDPDIIIDGFHPVSDYDWMEIDDKS